MGDAQTLCDRILLIDKGRRLLYGTVPGRPRRVQRRRRRGGRAATSRPTPDALRSVEPRLRVDGSVRYLLRDGATRARPVPGARRHAAPWSSASRVEAPDLAEIFLRTVAGDPRAERVA